MGLLCVVAGWAIGSAIGILAGVAADQISDGEWVSNTLLSVPIGGFLGALGGIWIGARVAPRVTSPWTERIGVLVAAGFVLVAVFVMIPVAKGFCLLPTADAFDPRQWRADSGDWPCGDRVGMTDQLVGEVLRPGMARAEVVELLGPPLEDPGIAYPDPKSLIWKVSCSIDCQWLIVSLGEDDRLLNALVASD